MTVRSTLFISAILLIECTNRDQTKILFTGDLMLDRGTRNHIEKYSAADLFENVRELFAEEDFVVANFEGAVCDTTLERIDKKFTFRANPEWISTLKKNGITHVTLANNHSFDFGAEGLKQTVDNLTFAEIGIIGYDGNSRVSCTPEIIGKSESNIAIFSCNLFLNRSNHLICNDTFPQLEQNIRTYKKENPEMLIIVCLHWGIEMQPLPYPDQIEQAHQLIIAGADAIIGHHPHVVQTIELYQGKLICYSIGNFIFDTNQSPTNRGILPEFTIEDNKITEIRIIPFVIACSKPKLMNIRESDRILYFCKKLP